ncbi:hypothetical protein MTO96_020207 [Rhipicephalus appendiculatus]
MKEGLENPRHKQVVEVQRLKSEQRLKSTKAATPKYVVKLKNRTAMEEQKSVMKNRAGHVVSQAQPQLPLRHRNLPNRIRPEHKLLTPPLDTKPPAAGTS